MPGGPGYGNGTGGVKGKIGVVADTGFGNGGNGETHAPQSNGSARIPEAPKTTPLVVLEHPRPNYTDEGRKLGIQGEVLLRVRFTATGGVEVLSVVQGLGHGLDEQAVLASKKIKFDPAKRDGNPIDFEATVHVRFELAS
jgi:TonB family protein